MTAASTRHHRAGLLLVSAAFTVTAIVGCTTDSDEVPSACPPADQPFTAVLQSGTEPPWADKWNAETMAAGSSVSASPRSATDDELISLTMACAGIPETALPPDVDTTTITVGVRDYLYTAAVMRTPDRLFVIGIAVERLDDDSARFGVKPMPVIGDISANADADGAAMIQRLREDQIL
ncbi:hypothetical protein [Rhodococcus sp. NBC_00297]|uniref:hypothetical protein n=1 Tax=Rhodococcus sp. NBC_00297 TaxID=2976005 RepID=UPI002E2C9BAF|nr:hypothetical protein [Rhodococcus sp. NBC_00297]